MTASPLTTLPTELQHSVNVRRTLGSIVRTDAAQPHGYVYDPALRCDHVRIETGPRVGVAELTYVPLAGDDTAIAFENIFAQYTTDDLVQIVGHPYQDQLQQQIDTRLFEGRIERHTANVQGSPAGENEGVRFTARALPTLDNESSAHQIAGRWIITIPPTVLGDRVTIVRAPSLPAVFNFRGRPNMAADTVDLLPAGLAIQAIPFRAFTHDTDRAGRYWTVRDAMLSLLAVWLIGTNIPYEPWTLRALPRFTSVEAETWAALAATTGSLTDDRWIGLGERMPEVNVHGLGVLDALQRICDATGFEFACLPATLTDAGDEYPYEVAVWRRNSGVVVYPKLAKRGTTFTDTEDALVQNDTNKNVILRDNSEIINEVHAIGRTVIEGVFTLVPLWSPSEVDGASIEATLQEINETNLAGSGYHAKHVVGGVLYNQHRHVGRWWGLNHEPVVWGYTTPANYVPHALGFDWVNDGEMNTTGSAMLAERAANGVDEEIVWMKRLRTPMPLRYPLAVHRGIEYLVRVSEDAGTTWYELPIRIKTLRDWFGFEILGIKNLAAVNRSTYGTDETPAVEDSWWALIASGQLQFQLGCAVEADHAAEYRATRSATSGSRYGFAKVMMTDIEERWAHRGLSLAMTGATAQVATWAKIPTYTHNAADTSPASLRSVAERERDALEDGVVSATLSTWIMDFRRYALGQQVGGLSGRNYSFAVSSGAAGARYPNIVGITYRLSGGQSIELSLDDHRLAAGR